MLRHLALGSQPQPERALSGPLPTARDSERPKGGALDAAGVGHGGSSSSGLRTGCFRYSEKETAFRLPPRFVPSLGLALSSVRLPTLIALTPARCSPEDARNPVSEDTAIVRLGFAVVRRLLVKDSERVHDFVKRHRPGASRSNPKCWRRLDGAASDAQDASNARFSFKVRSGSRTNSDGWANAPSTNRRNWLERWSAKTSSSTRPGM